MFFGPTKVRWILNESHIVINVIILPSMTWLRDTLNNKGARAKCLKWAYFALATSLHVLAKVTIWPVPFFEDWGDHLGFQVTGDDTWWEWRFPDEEDGIREKGLALL